MLEFSNKILKRGCTLYISKKPGSHKPHGTYSKVGYASQVLIVPRELPESEMIPIIYLPNIKEQLENNGLLIIYQDGYLVKGIIGTRKTEGPYCEKEYLEVHGEHMDFDYHEMLMDLEMKLAQEKQNKSDSVIQYKKLYKGVNRYE